MQLKYSITDNRINNMIHLKSIASDANCLHFKWVFVSNHIISYHIQSKWRHWECVRVCVLHIYVPVTLQIMLCILYVCDWKRVFRISIWKCTENIFSSIYHQFWTRFSVDSRWAKWIIGKRCVMRRIFTNSYQIGAFDEHSRGLMWTRVQTTLWLSFLVWFVFTEPNNPYWIKL